jgi:hypothetical protein
VTTRTATDAPDRPALPWPCVAILLAEVVVLGGLVAASRARPPLTYEAGWLGAGSMLVMQLYSVRRRVRALRHLGGLRGWLDAHVFLGLQGFVLTAYHSVGVSPSANLAAINFALVAAVVLTGLVGRYLYGLLPRARAADLAAYAALGGGRSRALAFRISALDVAERWFSRWTLLHRPLALVLLATTALHVLAHFAYAT